MAQNQRVYYPIHAVGFARIGTPLVPVSGYRAAKGVQSVGMTPTFALEQVYQLGQLEIYENIENIPDIEVTIEKAVDGYSLLQHLATPDAVAATLAGRYNDNQCMMILAMYPITSTAATGTPLVISEMSGLYLNSINWNIPLEGNITESIGLVCRDRIWHTAPSGSPWASGTNGTGAAGRLAGPFTGSESPVTASGGIQRRENVDMTLSRFPTEIPGINASGVNPSGATGFGAHIQNMTIAINLGRTDLFEQGAKAAYFRYANFPTEVTTTIEITATEEGDGIDVRGNADNVTDQRIYIALTNGITIDLGTKNKLQTVAQSGGDTGGGNVTLTYTYVTFNDYTCRMTVTDPAGL